MEKGKYVLSGSSSSSRDPLLGEPLLLQENEWNGDQLYVVESYSKEQDGVPYTNDHPSRMTYNVSDENSAPYGTSELTISSENLPVSFPVYVETASGDADVYRQSRQNALVVHASSSEDDDSHTEREEKSELPPLCEYVSYLVHLAVFGILGVLTRYALQMLFGPSLAGVTGDNNILYLDLPSNMVGCFLMGWLGVVFKSDISRVSDQLTTGLSTGYLGSLTTFSGWNQKMLDLSVNRHWAFPMLGYILGLILAAGSITFGVESASGFKSLLRRIGKLSTIRKQKLNRYKSNLILLLVLIFVWTGLWTTSGILLKKEFKDNGNRAQLWLACFVGPFGVWIRWWLTRLNGRGLVRWIPLGTLIANVSAACVMAALATVKKAVNTRECETIATGAQFGLMGCLSTVSTLMAEFNALRKSSHPWRAYAYVMLTIGMSFGLGTLIYSVPVWIKGYD